MLELALFNMLHIIHLRKNPGVSLILPGWILLH
jgi:hypothetical protein